MSLPSQPDVLLFAIATVLFVFAVVIIYYMFFAVVDE